MATAEITDFRKSVFYPEHSVYCSDKKVGEKRVSNNTQYVLKKAAWSNVCKNWLHLFLISLLFALLRTILLKVRYMLIPNTTSILSPNAVKSCETSLKNLAESWSASLGME